MAVEEEGIRVFQSVRIKIGERLPALLPGELQLCPVCAGSDPGAVVAVWY